MNQVLHAIRNSKDAFAAIREGLISSVLLPGLFFALCCGMSTTYAQTVSHPVSELSSTAKHYAYHYDLSPTQYKDLEYIIVKASNGDVKTVFNACDVCFNSHKGYSQSGTELRCNNCGNRFPIDGLGIKSTGGTCNPGYLPHTIQGDNVVINVSDLIVGAYFFLTQTASGIEDVVRTPGITLFTKNRQFVTVTLPSEGHRTFHVFTLTGQHRMALINAARIVDINIADLPAGAYVLAIDEAATLTTKLFLVY